MTADEFRSIALAMDGAIERAHMGHPDFRANGRIFATLHADLRHGMVQLTPEQQQLYVRAQPGAFTLEAGAWGRAGSTRVRLDEVDEDTLGEAMTLAWRNSHQSSARARPAKSRSTPPPRSRRAR